jgi:NADPH2:quinone reductase
MLKGKSILVALVINKSNKMNTITIGIVRITQPGKPEVLTYEQTEIPQPGEHEILIRQNAIGVNFLDVFFRNGTFPMPEYPALIGLEAAGIVEQIGNGVKEFMVGDRVAYYGSNGAYVEKRILPTNELFKLPDGITYDQAASIMIKGMTAHMLLKQSHELKAGEVVLIHAMTGGVGTLLSEWARFIGAIVIGTVGSAAKKDLALKRGFEHVIDLSAEDFPERIKEIAGDKGIDVFYDSVGVATFQKSLELVKPGGSAVLYGWVSGMPEINTVFIEQRKINFVQAVLNNYPAYLDKSGKGMPEIFALVRNGVFQLEKPLIYSLSSANQAHADLEGRKTTGSVILVPTIKTHLRTLYAILATDKS